MNITDIIGRGKLYEPPFQATHHHIIDDDIYDSEGEVYNVIDSKNKIVVAKYCECENEVTERLYSHIAELLNETRKPKPTVKQKALSVLIRAVGVVVYVLGVIPVAIASPFIILIDKYEDWRELHKQKLDIH